MSKPLARIAWLCLLMLCVGGCQQQAETPPSAVPQPAKSSEIYLHGAASAQDALNEIVDLYKQQQQVEIKTNYGSSATLAQQISQGAPANLFLSASTEWADLLDNEKLVAERRDLLGNRLVVIVPSDSNLKINSLDDLKSMQIEHLALGDPDSVPAGKYAKQALEKSSVWGDVEQRVVRGGDVRQALAFVERGEAEAGIVYATDAVGSTAVRLAYEIPDDLSEPIVYPLARIKSDEDSSATEQLFQFLCSPAAAEIFNKHGFEVLAAQEKKSDESIK